MEPRWPQLCRPDPLEPLKNLGFPEFFPPHFKKYASLLYNRLELLKMTVPSPPWPHTRSLLAVLLPFGRDFGAPDAPNGAVKPPFRVHFEHFFSHWPPDRPSECKMLQKRTPDACNLLDLVKKSINCTLCSTLLPDPLQYHMIKATEQQVNIYIYMSEPINPYTGNTQQVQIHVVTSIFRAQRLRCD